MKNELKAAILKEFADHASIQETYTHGCAAGSCPSCFIYNRPIVEFFDKWEDEIEDEMEDDDITYDSLVPAKKECQSLMTYKIAAVWWVVECACGEFCNNASDSELLDD